MHHQRRTVLDHLTDIVLADLVLGIRHADLAEARHRPAGEAEDAVVVDAEVQVAAEALVRVRQRLKSTKKLRTLSLPLHLVQFASYLSAASKKSART